MGPKVSEMREKCEEKLGEIHGKVSEMARLLKKPIDYQTMQADEPAF